MISRSLAAPPVIDRDIRDQTVNKGEMLKLKIPFSGTGPFDFTLKKGNRRVPESDRVKVIPYDDYVIVQIKGKCFASLKSSFFSWNVL